MARSGAVWGLRNTSAQERTPLLENSEHLRAPVSAPPRTLRLDSRCSKYFVDLSEITSSQYILYIIGALRKPWRIFTAYAFWFGGSPSVWTQALSLRVLKDFLKMSENTSLCIHHN